MKNSHILIAWNQIHAIWTDTHPIFNLFDWHICMLGENLYHHATVVWRQMLDHDIGHTTVGFDIIKKLLQSFQSPRRSTNTDHIKGCRLFSCHCCTHSSCARSATSSARFTCTSLASSAFVQSVKVRSFFMQCFSIKTSMQIWWDLTKSTEVISKNINILSQESPMQTRILINRGASQLTHYKSEELEKLLQTNCQKYFPNASHAVLLPDQLQEQLQRCQAENVERVIIGGGDGTVNAAAHCLSGTSIQLGVIPLGTFNLFARSLSIPVGLEAGLQALASAQPLAMDIGWINQQMFLNKATIGLHPESIQQRKQLQANLKMRHRLAKRLMAKWAVLKTLFGSRDLQVTITTSDLEKQIETPFVVIANNRFETCLQNLFYREQLDTGHLFVLYADKIKRWELLVTGLRILFGRGFRQTPEVHSIDTQEVSICAKRQIAVAIDGELHHLQSPLHCKILPQALWVLKPQ